MASSSCRCPPAISPLPSPSHSASFTVAAITLASLLAAAFLLLIYYAVLLRHRSSIRRLPPAAPPSPPHHAWLIHTVGLDESLIRSIPSAPFPASDSPHLACAVCLADLSDGDLVRFLPLCRHPFHLPCVDTWLRSHVTCPLCRSPVLPLPAPADSPPPIDIGASSSAIDGDPMDSSSMAAAREGSCCSSGRKDEEEEEGPPVERSLSGSAGGGFFAMFRSGRSSSVLPL